MGDVIRNYSRYEEQFSDNKEQQMEFLGWKNATAKKKTTN